MDIALFCASVVFHRRWWIKSSDPSSSSFLEEQFRNKTSLNAKERICTVTPENEPIPGGSDRATMRLHKLWHRATFCLIRHEPTHLPNYPQEDVYVIVQQRTAMKDYCPSKWDPTPGGVVENGESYRDNLVRELEEEMGITDTSSLQRLFTFPYQDENVKVWGEFYELKYTGTLNDLKLQESEVQQVVRMNLNELKERMTQTHPEEYMPDSIHAMELYFQHQHDLKVQRKFLKHSSNDLNKFLKRPPLEVLFVDCDDCLYFDGWKTAKKLTEKIEEWCVSKAGLRPGQAYELYKQYGTALRGLLAEGYIKDTPGAIDNFLQEVHDIGVDKLLQPDPQLQQMLSQLDPKIPKYIFTASVAQHAQRCIRALGIEEYFMPTIIDCKQCDLETKHSAHSFHKAMQIAEVQDPQACMLLDDSLTNIRAARKVGWRAVLVGKVGRDCGTAISSEHAELEVRRIHEIPKVLPELFVN